MKKNKNTEKSFYLLEFPLISLFAAVILIFYGNTEVKKSARGVLRVYQCIFTSFVIAASAAAAAVVFWTSNTENGREAVELASAYRNGGSGEVLEYMIENEKIDYDKLFSGVDMNKLFSEIDLKKLISEINYSELFDENDVKSLIREALPSLLAQIDEETVAAFINQYFGKSP